jgi:hypothetical protein
MEPCQSITKRDFDGGAGKGNGPFREGSCATTLPFFSPPPMNQILERKGRSVYNKAELAYDTPKGRMRMGKRELSLLGIICLLWAFNPFLRFAGAGEGPVISRSFAAAELMPGDTWKIYIRASSPDARMKYMFATVEQAGGMGYPVSITRIKDEDQKDLSGFFYLYTQSAGSSMEFVTLRLEVQIRDDRGRLSEPAVFPLTFKSRASLESPPAGWFREKELGPIMIRLRPVGDDGSSHDN